MHEACKQVVSVMYCLAVDICMCVEIREIACVVCSEAIHIIMYAHCSHQCMILTALLGWLDNAVIKTYEFVI